MKVVVFQSSYSQRIILEMNPSLYTLLNSNPAIEVVSGVGQHRIMADFLECG